MCASWIRREYAGVGVTQYPRGRFLEVVQREFGGWALLCIDVSGSMGGDPLTAAVEGGSDFLREARSAHYRCGLVLWNGGIDTHLPATAPAARVQGALRRARSSGGTNLAPALRAAITELGPLSGDRVVCVFGDGDVGDTVQVEQLAAQARAQGIRFVVRGLGATAAQNLSRVLTPDEQSTNQTVRDVGDLRQGIASMAAEARAGRRTP